MVTQNKTLTMKTILLIAGLISGSIAFAQSPLSAKQQSIVTISAFAANGEQGLLKRSLVEGLDAGLTINEIKEVLVQLYAYTGFPRSLNALSTFMTVLQERQQKDIKDVPGKLPTPLPENRNRFHYGDSNRTKLVGAPIGGGVFAFAPAIDQFLAEHLFGDIFGRDNLDWKTRELATISALAAIGKAEGQLRSHFAVGMRNGISAEEAAGIVTVISNKVGVKEGDSANAVLNRVLGRTQPTATTNTRPLTMTGKVTVDMIPLPEGTLETQVGSVSFEPGARTYWHQHPAGQILVVTDGTGLYQEKGTQVRIIRKGDVIRCTPGTVHWHGASIQEKMTHIAITASNALGRVNWMEQVTDAEYNSKPQ